MINWISRSLRIKLILIISGLIILIFSVSTIQSIDLVRSIFKNQIREKVDAYTQLASRPIIEAYEKYYDSGFLKFRSALVSILNLNNDIRKIELIDVEGKILFDSESSLNSYNPEKKQMSKIITDPYLMLKVRGIEKTVNYNKVIGGRKTIEVIYPFIETWGEHHYTLRYTFSYEAMNSTLKKVIVRMISWTIFFIIIGVIGAVIFSMGITRPLKDLSAAVTEVGKGKLDTTIDVKGKDELSFVSESFNIMISTLRKVMKEKDDYAKQLEQLNQEMEKKINERTNELAQKNKLLEDAAIKAQEADKAKSAFLAAISHELRTPLNSIIGFSGVLLQELYGPLNENERKDITTIYNNSKQLLNLINDILDISKIEAGKFDISFEPVDIKALIHEVIYTSTGLLQGRNIEIKSNVSPDTPFALADRSRVRQVILNLVGNAIKYTHSGFVIISGGIWQKNPDFVYITVGDTGIGISKEDQKKIFDEFVQLENHVSTRESGTGLGLALVRKFIEIMGGEIFVESDVGKGASFTFTLPKFE